MCPNLLEFRITRFFLFCALWPNEAPFLMWFDLIWLGRKRNKKPIQLNEINRIDVWPLPFYFDSIMEFVRVNMLIGSDRFSWGWILVKHLCLSYLSVCLFVCSFVRSMATWSKVSIQPSQWIVFYDLFETVN